MDEEFNPYEPIVDTSSAPPKKPDRKGLSGFDKFCAVLAFVLAVPLMLLGVIGVFFGCRANFSLPPVLGVLPAFVAWGIIRPIMVAWNAQR